MALLVKGILSFKGSQTWKKSLIFDHTTDNGTVLELTAGYETNLQNNTKRKDDRYKDLMSGMRRTCEDARFVNLSMSCLGFFGSSCDTFNDMLCVCELGLDDTARKFVYKRIIKISIRTTLLHVLLLRKRMD